MSINIFGVVGKDVRAADVLAQIQAEKGEVIEVTIMSPGGSVPEGLAIHDALRASGKEVHTLAMGQAASIASVIFMAGDVREIADNAELMIHNASFGQGGNKHQLKAVIDKLDNLDNKFIDIYVSKTGLSIEEVSSLLDKETFMSADEAISKGFATAKADALALVAIHNKTKEPVNMADKKEVEVLDEKEKGMFAEFLASCVALVSKQPKAEEVEEEEEAEVVEESKAEGDEEKVDVEALKAENAELKAAAAKADEDMEEKAKADEATAELSKVEASAKNELIFTAMREDKILASKAAELTSASLEDVKSHLEGIEPNATGRGSEGEPKKGSDVSKYEQYSALKDPAERKAFFSENKSEIINQSKES